jgi:hypothetical protein
MADSDMLPRMHETVEAVAPIHGVSLIGPQEVSIHFAPEATDQQKSDGSIAAGAFNWSQEAHDDWVHGKEMHNAKAAIDGNIRLGYDNRAIAKLIVDEINDLRQWITSFKSATAASSTLADFKTRIAALPNMPDRTMSQAKSAYKALIDSGVLTE